MNKSMHHNHGHDREREREATALLDVLHHNVLIAWKPDYDIGIRVIDEQHRGIVSTINTLYYGLQNKHGENMLAPITGMVFDYTRIHFELEEFFLTKCGYPDVNGHHLLHSDMVEALARVRRDSIMNRDPYHFMDFLKNWWIDHICVKDRVFRDYLLGS